MIPTYSYSSLFLLVTVFFLIEMLCLFVLYIIVFKENDFEVKYMSACACLYIYNLLELILITVC